MASEVEVDTQFRVEIQPGEFEIVEGSNYIDIRYRAEFGDIVNLKTCYIHYVFIGQKIADELYWIWNIDDAEPETDDNE